MRGAGFAGEIVNAVIYGDGGDTSQRRSAARLVGWRDVGGFFAGAEAKKGSQKRGQSKINPNPNLPVPAGRFWSG
jgi:hypothetical protein